jgi:predicted ester cyclase
MSQQEEDNKNVVRSMLEALDRRDLAALEKHPGLQETRRFHPLTQAAFPDLKYTIQQMIADGDMVATRAMLSGTHLGPLMGVAPTGKELTWGVLVLDRVAGDQIVEHWANAD